MAEPTTTKLSRQGGRRARRREVPTLSPATPTAPAPPNVLALRGALHITDSANRAPTLIVACGAIARELKDICALNDLDGVFDLTCLPASWHNTPERIVPALRERLTWAFQPRDDTDAAAGGGYQRVLIGYGDCGTGGQIDALLTEFPRAKRLPGDHCYAFFTGVAAFEPRRDSELRTFYLTDYLAEHFETVLWRGLGLDRYPHLLEDYFGAYEQVIYLAQVPTPARRAAAQAAAAKLGLTYTERTVGYGDVPAILAGG